MKRYVIVIAAVAVTAALLTATTGAQEKQQNPIVPKQKTVLWNGPVGAFEHPPFEAGSQIVAHGVVAATELGATSVVGGGDTAAAIASFDLTDRVTHVSTGGGATLEFLAGNELPGLAALTDKE